MGVNLLRLLLLLIVVLLAVFGANRLVADWHYVVPVEADNVAYLATFDDFKEDWNLAQGRLSAQILDTGALRLEVGDVDSLPFAETQYRFADFDLRVQASAAEGPINNGFGVIFRLQTKGNESPGDNNAYMFMISSDGYYRVVRYLDGVEKVISLWIPSDAVEQGIGATNWLRVVAKGDQFQFFVNNQLVQLCIPDDPNAESTYNEFKKECVGGQMLDTLVDNTIPDGQIGVAAQSFTESGVIVDFDNLVIYGPE